MMAAVRGATLGTDNLSQIDCGDGMWILFPHKVRYLHPPPTPLNYRSHHPLLPCNVLNFKQGLISKCNWQFLGLFSSAQASLFSTFPKQRIAHPPPRPRILDAH